MNNINISPNSKHQKLANSLILGRSVSPLGQFKGTLNSTEINFKDMIKTKSITPDISKISQEKIEKQPEKIIRNHNQQNSLSSIQEIPFMDNNKVYNQEYNSENFEKKKNFEKKYFTNFRNYKGNNNIIRANNKILEGKQNAGHTILFQGQNINTQKSYNSLIDISQEQYDQHYIQRSLAKDQKVKLNDLYFSNTYARNRNIFKSHTPRMNNFYQKLDISSENIGQADQVGQLQKIQPMLKAKF